MLTADPRHAEGADLKKSILYSLGKNAPRREWKAVLELDPRHPTARKNIEQAELILKKLEERSKR